MVDLGIWMFVGYIEVFLVVFIIESEVVTRI
jgi:hypothetical protein